MGVGGGGQACPNNWCSGGGGGGGASVGCSGAPIIVGAPPPPPPQFSKPSYAYVLKWLPTACEHNNVELTLFQCHEVESTSIQLCWSACS